jgi:hypothetical protein
MVLRGLTSALIRPFFATYVQVSGMHRPFAPLPLDAPTFTAPGLLPHRVLLIGDGLAMGFGVMSYGLALPGHLARSLSELTGRGAVVDVVAEEDIDARSLADRFEAAPRARYDAVVLMFGVTDAIQLTSLDVWRRGVRSFVDRAAGVGTPVVLVALPPIRRLPSIKGFAAGVIQRHAALFNRELLRISKQSSWATYLPFNPPSEQDPERHRSSKTYQAWAALIVPALAQVLGNN